MSTTNDGTPVRHTAGVFDIRTIIGLLLLVYGVIIGAMGLFADPNFDKTGGVNANLLAGGALLAVGAVFVLWARMRPIIVDERQVARLREDEPGH